MRDELVNKLYNRLEKEYLEYVNNMKKLSSEHIINSAYSIAIRQEIVNMFAATHRYDEVQLLGLLSKENILDFLYEAYENTGYEICDYLEEKLEDPIIDVGEELEEKLNSDQKYELVKNISDLLCELDEFDFCDYLKLKYNIENFDAKHIYGIINTRDGAKFLYNFCNNIRNDNRLLELKDNFTINVEYIDNIETKILPKLKEFIEFQNIELNSKNQKNYER